MITSLAVPVLVDENPVGGSPDSMANPPRPGGPPRPNANRPASPGARPRPAAPAPAPKPAMGGKAWTPPAKDGKPAGPVSPPAPTSDAKNLRMVPLTAEDGDAEIGQGKPSSSTEFFALPKRQSAEAVSELKRNDPIAQASRPLGAPPSAPSGPPPGSMPHGGVPAGPGLPPGMPMAVPMGISGPVAQGPLPPGYAAYQSGGLPPGANDDLERAKSYRVFAVVAGLMTMVMCALVVSLMVLSYGFYLTTQQEQAKGPESVPTVPAPRGPTVDTGGKVAPPPPPPPPGNNPSPKQPRPPSPAGGNNPAPATPKPPPQPKPPAPVASGPVTIKIGATDPYTSVELKCDGGERARGSFAGGVATIPNVPGPGQDTCRVVFKGGGGLPAAAVEGGRTYNCSFQGTVAICK